MGLIYLLHFERFYHHARHYLGYTEDLEARVAADRAGRGSPLVAAAVRDGIGFCVAATWPGIGPRNVACTSTATHRSGCAQSAEASPGPTRPPQFGLTRRTARSSTRWWRSASQ